MPTKSADDLFRELRERAQARSGQSRRLTPKERLDYFYKQGFRPHGIFLPDDDARRRRTLELLRRIGEIPDSREDERLRRYYQLQDAGDDLEARGFAGRWTGQQALARSGATFRLIEWGRRSGKTSYAAHEGVAEVRGRPRSVVWIAGQTYDIVDRCFSMMERILDDLGVELLMHRNTTQTKLMVLPNHSRIEGVSLKEYRNAAGAAVDLAIVDEAGQIEQEPWERAILPPLADRHGRALLIGSPEGDETFFAQQAETARQDGSGAWEAFRDASWDVNFYMFPQGRRSKSLVDIEKNIKDPLDFLEQFGAIPRRAQNRVFPEFRDKVHVGDWGYNPGHPVILAVDPSGGANAYAVAVIQDYKDYVVVIDEYYQSQVTAEEVCRALQDRPWRADVTDVILDSAVPMEIQRWIRQGWPAYPVFQKPQVYERLPLYRNLLRDPGRYHSFYRQEINALLQEQGLEPDADLDMPPDTQRAVVMQVEERLQEAKLTPTQVSDLKQCARLFVNKTCYWTIQEHRKYSNLKRPTTSQVKNVREIPADSWNHLLDALGYFTWTFHRFDGESDGLREFSTIRTAGESDLPPEIELPRPVVTPNRHQTFIRSMRERYATHTTGRAGTILRTVS